MARKKGEGRLFVRGDKWYMRWRYNGKETTKCTKISVSEEDSLEKAQKVLAEATEILRLRDKASRLVIVKRMLETTEEEIKDRIAGIRRGATLDELDAMFSESSYRVDCSEEQMEAYRRYIASLKETIGGGVKIVEIDANLAEQFSRSFADDVSPNTYNKYLNGLALVWRAVLPIVGSTFNPWDALPRKKLDTRTRRRITDEEIERVFKTATGEMKALFAIGLYTGLRLGDAVRLRWENIRKNAVYMKTGKTGANVAIPLHPRLAETLGERGDKTGPLCPDLFYAYTRFGRSSIAQRFTRLFKKCGIVTSEKAERDAKKDAKKKRRQARPVCGFHSLRHTFVSRCASAGIDRSVVQALVGHASASMTAHYTHLEDADFLAAFSKMA